MRAVSVYRVDYGRKTKDPIGVVFEMREKERMGNYNDLLQLARRLFAMDTADSVHMTVDVAQARRAPPRSGPGTVRRGSFHEDVRKGKRKCGMKRRRN